MAASRWHDQLDNTFINTSADYETRQASLSRYGIEPHPGPVNNADTTCDIADADDDPE